MSEPRISLCVPAYRAEPFIRATVDSCLAQTRPAHEIILSDDSSPDGTRAVLETYRDAPGVRIVYPSGHLGLGGHYRHVLEAATGSHVVILSSDDALHPRFLEDATGELARRPDLGLLAFGGYRCDARMRPRERFGLSYAGAVVDAPAGFDHFLEACQYLISFTVWRRPDLCALPALPEEAAITTDWYWALAIGARHAVKLSPTPRGYYRMHSDNASHSNFARWEEHAARMLRFLADGGVLPAECAAALSRRLAAPPREAGQRARRFPAELLARTRRMGNRLLTRFSTDHPSYLR